MENILRILPPAVGVVALAIAGALAVWVSKQDAGNDRMKEISGYIHSGAMAFLRREYVTMALVIAALCAEGTSRIEQAGMVDRGYERIDGRLRELGADIRREE